MGLVGVRAATIRLAGRSLRGRAPEDVARAGISLVPEGRRIFADFTVEENLRLGLAGRRSRAGADDDIEAVYALLPDRQRVRRAARARSRAASSSSSRSRGRCSPRPDVLLLDEPSLGLAPNIVDVVFAALARSASAASRSCSSSSAHSAPSPSATARTCIANGEMRMTLRPPTPTTPQQ